jgi:hypothetical protein
LEKSSVLSKIIKKVWKKFKKPIDKRFGLMYNDLTRFGKPNLTLARKGGGICLIIQSYLVKSRKAGIIRKSLRRNLTRM